MKKINGGLVDDSLLSLAHNQSYLDKIEQKVGMEDEGGQLKEVSRYRNSYTFQYDTYENMWTKHWAKLSTGSVIELIDAI